MEIILNIDVWLSNETGEIFTKPQPSEGFAYIPKGKPIRHEDGGPFIRRIKDVKIVFGANDLPEREIPEDVFTVISSFENLYQP